MIDFYAWATPNNHRVAIMLEETNLEYRVHPRNIRTGEQFAEPVLTINPMGKIPVIVDRDPALEHPISLFESGAILQYLAAKTGRFLPIPLRARFKAIQWLTFVLTQLGPTTNQSHHYRNFAPRRIDYAIQHHDRETRRVYSAIEVQLSRSTFLADGYSLADIACYPWICRHYWAEIDLAEFPNLSRWHETVSMRPAVQRGMAVPEGIVMP